MSISVCCLEKRGCFVLTIILLLTVAALELASLGTERWISQGKSPENDWEGGLRGPTSESNYFIDSKSYYDRWEDCNDNGKEGREG